MSIPLNEEHLEAHQSEINRKREEMLKLRPPEEVARMRVIESVSAQLEAAKIPFALFADPVIEPGKMGWIRFQRLEYMEDKTIDERVEWLQRYSYWGLFPEFMNYISKIFGIKHAVYYGEGNAPLFGHDLTGEVPVIRNVRVEE